MSAGSYKHDPQEEWEDPFPKKKVSLRWITTLVFVLSLYFFSIGPAFMLMRQKKFPKVLTSPFICPCKLFAGRLMNEFMGWYLDLWKPHP